MSTNAEERFSYLVALLCENTATEAELKELSASPFKEWVNVENEVHDLIIRRQLGNRLSKGSLRIKRATKDLIEISGSKLINGNVSIRTIQKPLYIFNDWDVNLDKRFIDPVPIKLEPEEESTLRIYAVDPVAPSGRTKRYIVTGFSSEYLNDGGTPINFISIPMQTMAPTLRAGNGLTIESLLTIAADQLQGLQNGMFPCSENGAALIHVRIALTALRKRTRQRLDKNIKNQPIPH